METDLDCGDKDGIESKIREKLEKPSGVGSL
jgi:hypothetical protein